MTSPNRDTSSAAQGRVRFLLVGMLVVLFVGVVFFRGDASESEPVATTAPSAGEASTTPVDEGSGSEGSDGSENTSSSTTVPATGTTDPNLPEMQALRLDLVFDGFRQPTVLTAPQGDERLFVAQRVGVIRILDESREILDPAFLDITDRVLAGGIEQGLLGLAFHPDFDNNNRFFVYYTAKNGNRRLAEYSATVSDPNRADPESEKILWEQEQPPDATDIRHYAGAVAFGPDGYLWFTSGDGADSRDQGQDPNTMFGAIMRIDVDSGDPYGIPPSNPFVEGGGAPEVFAYGLRNPWRFSIDPVERLLYIGDVGHADQEEVNVVSIDEGGYNFGWSDMEGTRCFHKQDCDAADYTSPVITYSHEEGLSVTGGYVYRGSEIPELNGTYFYSDWVSSWIKSFDYEAGSATNERDWTDEVGGSVGQPNTYGIDGMGEMYLLTHGGQVYKFSAVR